MDRLFKRLGYQKKPKHPVKRENVFDLYFANVPEEFFFVQIGASDGKLADPLYPYVTKYGLKGIAIEPIPAAFKLLVENYKRYPVKCLNVAVGTERGRRNLYIPKGGLAESTMASFTPRHGRDVVEVEVVMLADLEIPRVDLLQIDCEGHDWEILKTVNLEKWKPSLINFEHVLLSEKDKRESRAWLEYHGYKWFEAGMDTCAYLFK